MPASMSHSPPSSISCLAPASLLLALAITVGEFLVHYHVDWLKEQINRRKGWTVNDHNFWSLLGTDQFVHGLTYLAIVGCARRRTRARAAPKFPDWRIRDDPRAAG